MPPWPGAPAGAKEGTVAALRYVRRVGERWCSTALGRAVDGGRRGLTRDCYGEDRQRRGRLQNRRGAHRRGVVRCDTDRARVGSARLARAVTMATEGNRNQQEGEDKKCPDTLQGPLPEASHSRGL
jgi:hypothetical protein